MRRPDSSAAGVAGARAPGRPARAALSAATIRRLLPGDLLAAKYGQDDWWHERLILQPACRTDKSRFVVYTADGDLYDEYIEDYEKSLCISGEGTYLEEVSSEEAVQFGASVEPTEFLELYRMAFDYAQEVWTAEGLTPLTRCTSGVGWDGKSVIIPLAGRLSAIHRRTMKKQPAINDGPAGGKCKGAGAPVLPVIIDQPAPGPADGEPMDQYNFDPGPWHSWVIIDLGFPDIFGQTVSLKPADMVGGFRALHMLEDTKDYVVCMRRPNVGAREIVSWDNSQIAPLKQVYNVPEPSAAPADLRDLYGIKPDADGIGGKGDGGKGQKPEYWDDFRTLDPVWDSRGRRHLAWRDVCKHLSEETFSDWPDPDGVRTIMTFSNHIERHAQTPTA